VQLSRGTLFLSTHACLIGSRKMQLEGSILQRCAQELRQVGAVPFPPLSQQQGLALLGSAAVHHLQEIPGQLCTTSQFQVCHTPGTPKAALHNVTSQVCHTPRTPKAALDNVTVTSLSHTKNSQGSSAEQSQSKVCHTPGPPVNAAASGSAATLTSFCTLHAIHLGVLV
jgi:hypothetical protein